VGSRLPRRGWESCIDKRKCLEIVIKLPRGGQGTRRPDQQPITHTKTRSKDPNQKQRRREACSENIDQVPFNESEWAMNALLHLLQHPDLRFGINLLGGLPKPLDTHGRLSSRLRTFGSKINLSVSEIHKFVAPTGQLVRTAAPELWDRKFESRCQSSFPETAKTEKIKRNQEWFAELVSQPNAPSFASQNCKGETKLSFLNARIQRSS
jgi:hypothetical protein